MTLKTVKALKITHCRNHTSKKRANRLNIALLVVTDVGCVGWARTEFDYGDDTCI